MCCFIASCMRRCDAAPDTCVCGSDALPKTECFAFNHTIGSVVFSLREQFLDYTISRNMLDARSLALDAATPNIWRVNKSKRLLSVLFPLTFKSQEHLFVFFPQFHAVACQLFAVQSHLNIHSFLMCWSACGVRARTSDCVCMSWCG